MKKIFSPLGFIREKGQGLVEMAIVTPILIFMILGVFEVGWALRGYLVLTNVNREVTRFAIRPNYLNYSVKNNNPPTSTFPITPAYVSVGYNQVLSYTYETLSNQLPLIFSSGVTSSTMIISHMVIDTGLPCKEGVNCKCNDFVTVPSYISSTDVLTFDDLILHPGVPGYEYFYSAKFPLTSSRLTKYNYEQEALTLKRQNNKFNCELMNKSTSTIPSANNIIFTEIYYNQPQIFGFPLISNPLTDPVPMYAQTAMRMIVASRSGDNVDTVGPTCAAYPFIIRKQIIDAGPPPRTVDIFDGNGPNDFGFLAWNPTYANSSGYLNNELVYPRMALNDFYNVHDSSDRNLSVGDYVASLPGVDATIESSDALLTSLVGKTLRIPVWDAFHTEGNPDHYHISSFVWVRIESAATGFNFGPPDWTSNKNIYATYLGDATNDCQ